MHHSFMVTNRGWTQWMFFNFMVSGAGSLLTVHQPPVVTTALGHSVIMPCYLNVSDNDKDVSPSVLYWIFQNGTDKPRLWSPSEQYAGRVDLVDDTPNSLNMSILFKDVQWADSGKYLCKLSFPRESRKSFRRRGNETLLLVYDTVTVHPTGHNNSLLQCEVNVTRDPGFVLSVLYDGYKLQPVDSAPPGDTSTALTHVTLSETVSLRSKGEYECQLHLNEHLITKSIFNYNPHVAEDGAAEVNVSLRCPTTVPVAEDGRAAEVNVSLRCPTAVPRMVVFPEPWLLYMLLLLVPITILLALIAATLLYRCGVCQHLAGTDSR